MPKESAAEFLKKYLPFSLLENRVLQKFVKGLAMEIYPAGEHLLRQGAEPSGGLYIIRDGSVRIYAVTSDGEHLIDYRSEGDTIGFLSASGKRRADASVQAVNSVTCYVAAGESVTELLREHPELGEYLLPSYFPKRKERAASHGPAGNVLRGGTERFLFTTPLRDLADRRLVTVSPDITIRDAATLMSSSGADALVVMGPSGTPVGLVTNTDLRDRVLLADRELSAPVGTIMSAPPVRAEGGDFCFEAAVKMVGGDVRHLLVTESGRPVGIVGFRDFLSLLVASPLMIAREIESQTSVEGVAETSGKVRQLVTLLLGEGASAESILRIVTGVNDLIERKILDFATKTLGPPPVPLCWIVYGSAGRREQTFKTDQDNAIVYMDPRSKEEAARAESYFSRYAEFVVNGFLRCGFSLCCGDFMATNPLWRQPLSGWKKYFGGWIHTPDDTAVYNASNFFDFRGLYGEMGLAAELKTFLTDTLRDKRFFLQAMAAVTVSFRPPLGLFGSFIVGKGGEHPNQLDIKKTCLTPLVNIVRLRSLESGVQETGTLERIASLKRADPSFARTADELAHAFEFISLLRLRHQWEASSFGAAPDNFINPKRLNSLERKNLKEICRFISSLLDEIERSYAGGTPI